MDRMKRNRLFKNEVVGEKCINSPKQPQLSILPNRLGMNRFVAVRYTKNNNIARYIKLHANVILFHSDTKATTPSRKQTDIAISKE
ncbi:hypothetical protein CIL02_11130 [Prevotella sp. P3-122]|nr:hypothetical protein CIL02_11130 [Prevotella sp. P3-122]